MRGLLERMLGPGDALRGYRIVSRLRAGGMATLFLGVREGAAGFARPVAIKTIHQHLANDARFVQMFIDEARLAAKVDDPHVVRTEELGEENGDYFLVMEYVEGCALSELLRVLSVAKRALLPELATWIAMQIAMGLQAAHEATDDDGRPLGLVHRDVSPHNVLLAFKGHVKIIDFGIAKARGLSRKSESDLIEGKVAYMAPEQAWARPIDRRADVYALGVILWEMLTMQRLFDADNPVALLGRVREPCVVPPSTHAPLVPPALDAAVMRALAVDPADRPATAEAFREILAEAMPKALAIASRDLAVLLAAAMPKHLATARAQLQGLHLASTSEPELSPTPGTTMTVEMPTARIDFDDLSRRRRSRAVRPLALALTLALALGGWHLGKSEAGPATLAAPAEPPSASVARVVEAEAEAEPPPTSAAAPPPPRIDEAPVRPRSTSPRRPARAAAAPRPAPSTRVIMVDGVPIGDKL